MFVCVWGGGGGACGCGKGRMQHGHSSSTAACRWAAQHPHCASRLLHPVSIMSLVTAAAAKCPSMGLLLLLLAAAAKGPPHLGFSKDMTKSLTSL
jgi:hypothetical protein